MRVLIEFWCSIILIGFMVSSCNLGNIKKHEPNADIERCMDCIYLEDFDRFERNKGAKALQLVSSSLQSKLMIKWWMPNAPSFPPRAKLHFYLRNKESDSLNTLVCYITRPYVQYEINSKTEESIVEFEVFKVFMKDEFLETENIPYTETEEGYGKLKSTFEILISGVEPSEVGRPQNYGDFNGQNRKRPDYFEQKEDVRSFSKPGEHHFVMTANRPIAYQDLAFDTGKRIFRKEDMAIYITHISSLPKFSYYRDNRFTLNNIEELDRLNKDRIKNDIPTLQEYYDSIMKEDAKIKYDVIRKNRSQVPFNELLDSLTKFGRRDTNLN